jgi:upstream activation factor subunit UAF30
MVCAAVKIERRPCANRYHDDQNQHASHRRKFAFFPLEIALRAEIWFTIASTQWLGVFCVFKGEKTMAVKKKAAKKPAKKKSARKPSAAFMKPMQISAALAAVIGAGPYPRTEVTKKLWVYIKKHGLQDSKNRRNINADEKLKEVFGGKKQVSMFDMTKLVGKHLK